MHPLTLPIWLAGLWFYFFAKPGKPFRALGWAWVFTAAVIVISEPARLLSLPGLSDLFAAGGVCGKCWLDRRLSWLKLGVAGLAGRHGRRARAVRDSGAAAGDLHPVYAGAAFAAAQDRNAQARPAAATLRRPVRLGGDGGHGGAVYNSLPPDVRAKTAIFGQNYGQAGAIDLFGPKYGLPPAISGHQSYFLWGPRGYTGESVIVMAGRQEDLETRFADGARRWRTSSIRTRCLMSTSTSSIAAA